MADFSRLRFTLLGSPEQSLTCLWFLTWLEVTSQLFPGLHLCSVHTELLSGCLAQLCPAEPWPPQTKVFFWHEQRKDLESQSSELLAKGAVSADHSTGRASSWEELELLLLCLGCSPLPAELSCCLRPNCLHQPEGVYHRQELSFLSLLTCIYQVIQTTPISVISSPRPLSGIVDNSSRLDSLYLFCVWKRKKSMKGSPGKNLGTQELY
jgi:hypothetical protein